MFNKFKKEDEKEETPIEETPIEETSKAEAPVEEAPVVEEPVVEEPVAEEKPATPHLTPVTWNPSNQKQKDFVHDSDSNIKAPGENSFL